MKTSTENLEKWVSYFVGFKNPGRHFGNLDGLNIIANDVDGWFKDFGLEVSRQTWNVRGNDYHNVIGKFRPELKERLIVGAHYDVYGDNPGADDNASGMAGLLEAARLITAANSDLDYGIDFVAYCLEEPPFFGSPEMGSHIHASSLSQADTVVKGMVCYDMIGYFSDERGSQNFPNDAIASLYPDTADFILVIGCQQFAAFAQSFHGKMAAANEMDVQLIVFPSAEDLGGLSDHTNYWHFGYDALMINNSAFMRNPNYHEKTDTIDTLDFNKMRLVVDASVQAIIAL